MSGTTLSKKLLEVKFSKESKILITSRSRPVLKELLKGCDEATCIDAVPSMKREEALRTFEMSFGHDLSYVPYGLLDGVLRKCLFGDRYHPLALKALGKMLIRMQGEVEANISRLSLSLVNASIETLIRTNYDNIPSIRKLMFLDIVVVFFSDAFCNSANRRIAGGYDAIQRGLRILYVDERHSKDNIDMLMHQLAWDGVLDFEGVDDDRRIKVHDLYLDLAKGEASASPRFFLGGGQENRIDWSMVKRVILPPAMEKNNMVKVIKQNCPELEVLIAKGWELPRNYRGELQLAEHKMGALRFLMLDGIFLDISTSRFRTGGGMRVDGWRGCVRRLAWLELSHCKWVNAVEAVYDMDRLEVLFLKSCEGPWKNRSKLCDGCGGLEEFIVEDQFYNNHNDNISNSLGSLNNLKKLQLSGVRNLNSLTVNGANLQLLKLQGCCNLQEICSLGPLHDLITLSVSHCNRLQAITGLNGATQLQQIHIEGNKTLKEIPGLHDLINLQTMRILGCQSLFLKSITLSESGQLQHFICSSRKLQIVQLHACETCEEIEIPGLVDLSISDCHRLKSITLSEAGQRQKIFVSSCEGLEKIVVNCPLIVKSIACRDARKFIIGAHGQIQSFYVWGCDSLEEIQGLHGFSNIESFSISGCRLLKSIPDQLKLGLHNLNKVEIEDCHLLKTIPPLSGAVQLRKVNIEKCGSLEEIQALSGFINLEWFRISDCPRLKAIPPLSGAVQLRKVKIENCGSLEEIQALSGLINLEWFGISDCPRLKAIPPLSGAVISISDCPRLRGISITGCPRLKAIPPSSGVVQLKQVKIENCGSLEEIGLINLKWLGISDCPRLKAIQLSGDVQLIRGISIRKCGSLEEIQAGSGLINLKSLKISDCPSLKQILLDLCGAVQLVSIKIGKCGSLEEIPALSGLFNLQSLEIDNCPRLKVIPPFSSGTVSGLINLYSLKIRDCPRLKAVLLDLTGAVQLEIIEFKSCESLEEIPTLHLSKLEYLYLGYCPRLKAIPDLSGVVRFVHIGQEYGDHEFSDDGCEYPYSDEYTDDGYKFDVHFRNFVEDESADDEYLYHEGPDSKYEDYAFQFCEA